MVAVVSLRLAVKSENAFPLKNTIDYLVRNSDNDEKVKGSRLTQLAESTCVFFGASLIVQHVAQVACAFCKVQYLTLASHG